MDEWDDVVRIEVDGKPYEKKPFPPKTELDNYPWMIVRLVNGGNREIQFFKNETDLQNSIPKKEGLYKSFKNAMEIRKILIELLDYCSTHKVIEKEAYNTIIRWFCGVQTIPNDCGHNETDKRACHFIFDNTLFNPVHNLHVNDGAAILDFQNTFMNGTPWFGKIRALEICAGRNGAILFMWPGLKGPCATFPGNPNGGAVRHTNLLVNGYNFQFARSDKDLA